MELESRQMLVGWLRYFGLTLALYLAALALSIWAIDARIAGAERTLLILAPILPGMALIWLTIRSYRRCDEFIRLRILQSASVAAVVTAVAALIYFFLELLGLPRLSAAWTSNLLWMVFVVQMVKLLATGK
tara:strand:- start:1531 stop:1923 length:393 start_codon:yes stop_codon:yes gene_type:complete